MKFYVAARFFEKETVKEVYRRIVEKGHSITKDWTEHEDITPYGDNIPQAQRCSKEDIRGVIDADVFILLTSAGGHGMWVELGAAIATCAMTSIPAIFVVGPHADDCMFSHHPLVTVVNNLDEVFELGI